MASDLFKRISGQLNKIINDKIGKIHPIAFENTKLLDDIHKANEGMNRSMDLVFVLIMILYL